MVTYALCGRSCNPPCYARRVRGWDSCCSLYLGCAFLWPAKFIGLGRLVSRRLRLITTIAAAVATAAARCSSTRVGTLIQPACLPLAHAAGRSGHQEVPTASAPAVPTLAAAPRGAQRCSCQPSSCLLPPTAGMTLQTAYEAASVDSSQACPGCARRWFPHPSRHWQSAPTASTACTSCRPQRQHIYQAAPGDGSAGLAAK